MTNRTMTATMFDETSCTMTKEATQTSLEPKSRRFVSFTPQVSVRDALHIDDYTDEEHDACWFISEDYENMKKEIDCTVGLIERKATIDEIHYCRRGVERRTKEASESRHHTRIVTIDAVLDEQYTQSYDTINGPELIAIAYMELNYRCQMAAYVTGVTDAEMTKEYLQPKKQSDSVRVTPIRQNSLRLLPRKLFSTAA
jgi:hypothetical protein